MNTVDCGCIEGYYDDGINVDCIKCRYSCLNCSSPSICIGNCSTTLYRNPSP